MVEKTVEQYAKQPNCLILLTISMKGSSLQCPR
jgi:hypothetical protein